MKEGEVGTCRRGAMGREGRREEHPISAKLLKVHEGSLTLGVKAISIKGTQSLPSETS